MTEDEMISRAEEILQEVRNSFEAYYTNLNRYIDFSTNNKLRLPAGRIRHNRRDNTYTIDINKRLFAYPENEHYFQETILHEIAHAMVGFSSNHNFYWRHTLVKIGGNGKKYHALTKGLKRNNRKRHKAFCSNCLSEFQISTQKRNKILKGYKYRHIICPDSKLLIEEK